MSQGYYIINLDKKEFLQPQAFGEGHQMCAFGRSSASVMFGLAILLADGSQKAGGDVRGKAHDWAGRWKGDRIKISGDYADDNLQSTIRNDLLRPDHGLSSEWHNISIPMREAIDEENERDGISLSPYQKLGRDAYHTFYLTLMESRLSQGTEVNYG